MKVYCLFSIALVIVASALSPAQQSGDEGAGSPANTPKSTSERQPRVRVANGIMAGLLIRKVQPKYPEDAKQAGVQGTVVLKALIDKDGNVEDLTLASGHEMLAPAAIEAVKQWKYKPYRLNGEPVNVETQVRVNFALSKH